jgi:hypothetical protein
MSKRRAARSLDGTPIRANHLIEIEQRLGAEEPVLADCRPTALMGHVIEPRIPRDQVVRAHDLSGCD